MATLVWKDCKIFWHEFNLSAYHNELTLNPSVEILDATKYGDSWRTRDSGLATWEASASGFWDAGAGDPDTELYGDLAVANRIITLSPTGTDGDPAYFAYCILGNYSPVGQTVGELMRFTWNAYGEGELYRGTIMHNNTRIASGNGSGRQLGALSATQTMYAALHCTSASAGDTLDVVIQSEVDNNWGTPTNQITFTQVSGGTETAEIKSKAGAVTDTWWRVNYTIGGVDPSFTFIVTLAIV